MSLSRRWMSGWSLISVLLISGCGDMPVMTASYESTPPKIVLGPYITDVTAQSLTLRFETDRRCAVALLSKEEEKYRKIERYAAAHTFHALKIKGLNPNSSHRYAILLDDVTGPSVSLRSLPEDGGEASVAFSGGSKDYLQDLSRQLLKIGPDIAVFTSSPFAPSAITSGVLDQKNTRNALLQEFFEPLAATSASIPFFFPPGVRDSIVQKLFPAPHLESGIWSQDLGALHLVWIDAKGLKQQSQRVEMLEWLDRDLARFHAVPAWIAVVLSEPLFGIRETNARLLQILGDRFERAGVDLVISGGAGFYCRTHPIGTNRAIRYVTIGDPGRRQSIPRPREYVAVASHLAPIGVIAADEGHFSWQATDMRGKVLDSFELTLEGIDKEPVVAKHKILSDALAVMSLRREMLCVARQACRTVRDIKKPFSLNIHMSNPSIRRLKGSLAWQIPEKPRWTVRPERMLFDLSPGERKRIVFTVTPGKGSSLPRLRADAGSIGYAVEKLTVVPEKRISIPFISTPVDIDGRLREGLWEKAVRLEGFRTLVHGEAPARIIIARLAANSEGLLVSVICEAEKPKMIKNTMKHRDDPIYRGESIEVFIDPNREGREYYQFSIGTGGIILDRSSKHGLAWNPVWKKAVAFERKDEGYQVYSVEMLIPYKAVGQAGPPAPGSVWGINITRNDYHEVRKKKAQRCEVVQWARTYGRNSRSGLYGAVVFSGKASATPAVKPEKRTAPPEVR